MGYNYIHFTTWNLDWWKRTCTDINCSYYKSPENIAMWKNMVKYNLAQLHSEFILLQEFNPFSLYDNYKPDPEGTKVSNNYNLNRTNTYFFDFAHELAAEKVENNFWGSAIIADEKYKFVDGYCKPSGADSYNLGLMVYDFKLAEDNIVTVINFYNKGKNGNYNIADGIVDELKNIMETKKENMILLAGMFI